VFPASGGSGGGSVNSVNGVKPDEAGNVALKYDDLENRPFGEETSITEIVPETVAESIEEGVFGVALPVRLTAGNEYIVKLNGVEYACTGVGIELDEFSYPVGMGNLSVADESLPATDDPFLILDYPEYSMLMVMMLDGTESVTLSLSGAVTTIHPLHPKYRPNNATVNLVAMGMADVTAGGEPVFLECDTSEIIKTMFAGTTKFIVKLDGVKLGEGLTASHGYNVFANGAGDISEVKACVSITEWCDLWITVSPIGIYAKLTLDA
jgi:hypothetical protein